MTTDPNPNQDAKTPNAESPPSSVNDLPKDGPRYHQAGSHARTLATETTFMLWCEVLPSMLSHYTNLAFQQDPSRFPYYHPTSAGEASGGYLWTHYLHESRLQSLARTVDLHPAIVLSQLKTLMQGPMQIANLLQSNCRILFGIENLMRAVFCAGITPLLLTPSRPARHQLASALMACKTRSGFICQVCSIRSTNFKELHAKYPYHQRRMPINRALMNLADPLKHLRLVLMLALYLIMMRHLAGSAPNAGRWCMINVDHKLSVAAAAGAFMAVNTIHDTMHLQVWRCRHQDQVNLEELLIIAKLYLHGDIEIRECRHSRLYHL